MERETPSLVDYLIAYVIELYISIKFFLIALGIWTAASWGVEQYHELYPDYRARIAQYDAETLTANAQKALRGK